MHCLETITSFVEQAKTNPQPLVDVVNAILTDSKTTPTLRVATLQCLHATCTGDSLAHPLRLLPNLLSMLDSAVSSPHNSAPGEVCLLACIVIHLLQQRLPEAEAVVAKSKFFALTADGSVLGKKFFSTATDSHLLAYLSLAEYMIDRQLEVKDTKVTLTAWYSGLISSLLAASYNVRKEATARVSALLVRLADTPSVRDGLVTAFVNSLSEVKSLIVSYSPPLTHSLTHSLTHLLTCATVVERIRERNCSPKHLV